MIKNPIPKLWESFSLHDKKSDPDQISIQDSGIRLKHKEISKIKTP